MIHKKIQLVEITQDGLIAEQIRDSEISEIVSKINNVQNLPDTVL